MYVRSRGCGTGSWTHRSQILVHTIVYTGPWWSVNLCLGVHGRYSGRDRVLYRSKSFISTFHISTRDPGTISIRQKGLQIRTEITQGMNFENELPTPKRKCELIQVRQIRGRDPCIRKDQKYDTFFLIGSTRSLLMVNGVLYKTKQNKN